MSSQKDDKSAHGGDSTAVVVAKPKAGKGKNKGMDARTKEAIAAAEALAERRAQKRMSIFGFAAVGLLMGFLWGANLVIQVVDSPDCLIQALRVGTAVATNTASWSKGIFMGLIGMLVGGSFGYSLFLVPRHMAIGLVGGGIGLTLGALSGGMLMGGLGWSAGFLAAMFSIIRFSGIRA